jgi:hypothetical protein
MKLQKQKLLLSASGLLWLAVVGAGMGRIWGYENAPGAAAQPPEFWPAESGLQRTRGRATLVMLAHPHCPCTRASIGELALLMARCRGRLNAHVLFIRPDGLGDGWAQTDLWQSAAGIPGVTASLDADGVEARRFRAETSGQVLLYDAGGRLLFSGGITGSRGHSGDNAGRSAITSLVTEGATERDRTLVFGCSLFDQHCADQSEGVQ